MRQAISNAIEADNAARAARLLEAIKIETRWLLLSARARPFGINEDGFDQDRANLVSLWPDFRHRRVPAAYLRSFYDLVADQASLLAHLIEIRRQRQDNRKAHQ